MRPHILLLFTVLGLVSLWRGIQLYLDHLDRRDEAAAAATVAAAKPPGPLHRPAGPAPPTDEEIAALDTADRITRLKAGDVLLTRTLSPSLWPVLDALTLKYVEDDQMLARLACLGMRIPDARALASAFSFLPTTEDGYRTRLEPDLKCALETVAERAGELPERARDVLLAAVFSPHFETHERAAEGLRKVVLDDFPATLQVEVRSPDVRRRRQAIRAALAVGAIDKLPSLVERALLDSDYGVSDRARYELLRSKSAEAPRIIARTVTEQPDGRFFGDMIRRREAEHRDAEPAILDIVEDESREPRVRLNGMRLLVAYGSIKAADRLRTLAARSPEDIRMPLEDAIVAIEKHHGFTAGRPPAAGPPK
jgi:hypothetical protein